MVYTYTPKGTCSMQMVIELDDKKETILSAKIVGGCPGNTVGLSKMVEGQKVDEVIEKLRGIPCGNKPTSCPDQLARALEEIKKAE